MPAQQFRNDASWKIDKASGVPLYLQVKELVLRHLKDDSGGHVEVLPTVSELATTLGIAFETARKAYKLLSAEGVIVTSRGRRTVSRHPDSASYPDMLIRTKNFLSGLLASVDGETARSLVGQAFAELESESTVIFTECNATQIEEFPAQLAMHLSVAVRGVLIKDLRPQVAQALRSENLSLVLTTGFHINEVQDALKGMNVEVDCVVTSMSPDMRHRLESFHPDSRFGFICCDLRSIPFYRDLIMNELGLTSEVVCATMTEARETLSRTDVVLCAAPVFREIQRMAPPGLPVFNVFDRVDPVSLLAIKERIFAVSSTRRALRG